MSNVKLSALAEDILWTYCHREIAVEDVMELYKEGYLTTPEVCKIVRPKVLK